MTKHHKTVEQKVKPCCTENAVYFRSGNLHAHWTREAKGERRPCRW